MAPRTILYTGKGGVGKTSVAAATARACAARGLRTLVLSTDPAHSLADALQEEVGGDPTRVGDRLSAQQVSAQSELEANWSGVQGWMGSLLSENGVNRISADELTVPPGADELFSLLQLQAHLASGDWDAIIVDCAPTGETLRLLSFPDAARWWLGKVFGRERELVAAARPFVGAFLGISLPDERVFREVQRFTENLVTMNELLRGPGCSLRLVMTPDRLVIDEAMRTFTYLNLYGLLCDAVVVNRVFPPEVDGTYFGAWRAVQQQHLELVESGFAPVPVLRAPYFAEEVLGKAMLDRLGGALFGAERAPEAVLHDRLTRELRLLQDGTARLRLELPFAEKGRISLKKAGLELVVGVDGQKRVIALPPALAEHRPAHASFRDGALEVRFEPAEVPARV